MISFCIKSNNNYVIDKLLEDISLIDIDGIIFSKKDFSKYTNIILHYAGKKKSEFYNEITSVLCNFILEYYEPIIIKNMIYLNYFYFDYSDFCTIENNCKELLTNNTFTPTSSSISKFSKKDTEDIYFTDRKKCLWTSILKYITNHKSMILDGFVCFRISDYIKYIDNAIDSAVNQFVIDKEYYDFINLLKLYIEAKPESSKLLHLIYINGESILLDEEKNIINISKSNLNVNYLSDITFSSNDYALNSLLTLLPSKIIIHLITPEDEFINTLKLIFENKISICTDCNICQTYRLLQAKQH